MNLTPYLERIDIPANDPLPPNLPTLERLHEAHVRAIPFENLDVIDGRSIRLELEAIVAKLVDQRRGGYCFEHNALFAAVLRAIGYHVTDLLARVRWQAPADAVTAKTHHILKVHIDGRAFLADVGFGGTGLLLPLEMNNPSPQGQRFEPRRLLKRGPELVHQIEIEGEWLDLYAFTQTEAFPIDFEVANWYTSTHPTSRFTQNLIVSAVQGDERVSLHNREIVRRPFHGEPHRSELQSPQQLQTLLDRVFNLRLPADFSLACPGLDW